MRKYLLSPRTYYIGAAVSLVATATVYVVALRENATVDSHDPRVFVESSIADWIGPPPTLEWALEHSDIVVVGRVTGIDSTLTVYPEGYSTPSAGDPPAGHPGIPFTDLTVEVEEYLRGSGEQSLILRQTGDLVHTDGFLELPKPTFGERMLLFLSRDPAGRPVWHSGGAFGQLIDYEGEVSWPFLADTDAHVPRRVHYFPGMSLEQAIAATREAIATSSAPASSP